MGFTSINKEELVMILYRLESAYEHSEHEMFTGAYRSLDYKWYMKFFYITEEKLDSAVLKWSEAPDDTESNRHPMASNDNILKQKIPVTNAWDLRGYFYFFNSPEQLNKWFSRLDIKSKSKFQKYFQISQYHCSYHHVLTGETQCIAKPQFCTVMKRWSIKEWIKAYY